MIAKLENNAYTLYSEANHVIGTVKINLEPNFTNNQILVDQNVYTIIRDGWAFEIYENDKIVYHLKTNSFSGNITVLELDKKIKGVFSLIWGTQLVDKNNETLLKIKNESQLLDSGNYIIELSDSNMSHFEILLALFGHLYGSNMKTKAVIGAV